MQIFVSIHLVVVVAPFVDDEFRSALMSAGGAPSWGSYGPMAVVGHGFVAARWANQPARPVSGASGRQLRPSSFGRRRANEQQKSSNLHLITETYTQKKQQCERPWQLIQKVASGRPMRKRAISLVAIGTYLANKITLAAKNSNEAGPRGAEKERERERENNPIERLAQWWRQGRAATDSGPGMLLPVMKRALDDQSARKGP